MPLGHHSAENGQAGRLASYLKLREENFYPSDELLRCHAEVLLGFGGVALTPNPNPKGLAVGV